MSSWRSSPKVVVRYNLCARKGCGGYYSYQYRKGSERRIVVNLDFHEKERRRLHRSAADMIKELMQTLDHEIAHALAPQIEGDLRFAKARKEESFIKRFERAGAWARR